MQDHLRRFDLNIERVLEHWTVAHALREVIANSLDEAALTQGAEPTIFKDSAGAWHIQDSGRGLRYEHLTQNENKEKLKHPELVIGKFGVGLKDAFATFDRHCIGIRILSPHGDITIAKAAKHGFSDVTTLHAMIAAPSDTDRTGTEFILDGVKDEDVAKAKDFFLQYSGDVAIARTTFGAVLQRAGKGRARIYVNGLFVAEEERFLFSYNITSLTAALRKALNRERTNVGRGAYTDRVKAILLACEDAAVADALARDLEKLDRGLAHDELQWLDVQLHACRILNANEKVVFVTSEQLLMGGALITHARNDGYRIVVIPFALAHKLPTIQDIHGDPIRGLDEYRHEWNNSFTYAFVSPDQLRPEERAIYALTHAIMGLLPKWPARVKEVLISETMRLNDFDTNEAVGVWEGDEARIIIKRTQLQQVATYAGTLLHECTHALTNADDETPEFEHGLTVALGAVAELAMSSQRA